jgi:hypothetical protein
MQNILHIFIVKIYIFILYDFAKKYIKKESQKFEKTFEKNFKNN